MARAAYPRYVRQQSFIVFSRTLKLLGCSTAGFIVVASVGMLLASQPIAQYALVGLAAAILLAILVEVGRDALAIQEFRREFSAVGKDLLLVYSSSPHWQDRIETQWMTRWKSRSVILNRSDPEWQKKPGANLWRRVAGSKEHTPIAIVVPASGKIEVVRFFLAFRDYKHGKTAAWNRRSGNLRLRSNRQGKADRSINQLSNWRMQLSRRVSDSCDATPWWRLATDP
jgi:hypothetical protein